MKRPPKKLVREAYALRQQIKALEAEYELRALEIKNCGEGVYAVPEAAAIVSEYDAVRTDWKAVIADGKVPARIVRKHTKHTPTKRLDWSEPDTGNSP